MSQKTNKEIIASSIKCCVNDACLPVKLFHGHAKSVIDKADYLFVPRIKSIEKKEYICPKISGLPEMIKFSIPSSTPIIDVEVNLRKSKKSLYESFMQVGLYITEDKKKIQYATNAALHSYNKYRYQMTQGTSPNKILDHAKSLLCNNSQFEIAVLGHSYNLYDEYLNMGIMKKLYEENIKILTPEMLDYSSVQKYSDKIGKKVFWSLGKRQIGALFWTGKQLGSIFPLKSLATTLLNLILLCKLLVDALFLLSPI